MKIALLTILFPAAGMLGLPYLMGLWLMRCVVNPTAWSFVTKLPGLAGGLYWTTAHRLFRLAVPVTCMVLFLTHPVGYEAWGYTMYWLIPIAVFVARRTSIIAHAFASTFITHAVGSVIFLYSHDTTALYWWGLIPRVACERTLFAAVLVFLYNFCSNSKLISQGNRDYGQACGNSDGRESPLGKKAGSKTVLWPWGRCQNHRARYRFLYCS